MSKLMPLDSCRYCIYFEQVWDDKWKKPKAAYCCFKVKSAKERAREKFRALSLKKFIRLLKKLTAKEYLAVQNGIGDGNRYIPKWCPLGDDGI